MAVPRLLRRQRAGGGERPVRHRAAGRPHCRGPLRPRSGPRPPAGPVLRALVPSAGRQRAGHGRLRGRQGGDAQAQRRLTRRPGAEGRLRTGRAGGERRRRLWRVFRIGGVARIGGSSAGRALRAAEKSTSDERSASLARQARRFGVGAGSSDADSESSGADAEDARARAAAAHGAVLGRQHATRDAGRRGVRGRGRGGRARIVRRLRAAGYASPSWAGQLRLRGARRRRRRDRRQGLLHHARRRRDELRQPRHPPLRRVVPRRLRPASPERVRGPRVRRVGLVASAIRRADSVKPAEIRDALQATRHFPGVTERSATKRRRVPQKKVTVVCVGRRPVVVAQFTPATWPRPDRPRVRTVPRVLTAGAWTAPAPLSCARRSRGSTAAERWRRARRPRRSWQPR